MARKRHHQSRRARFHEHSGEERHLHGYHLSKKARHEEEAMEHKRPHHSHGAYEGHESRRHMEMMDSGMIHEDRHQIANLPQEVMIKPYPMTGPYMPEDLDDTIRGIDHQMDYDDHKRKEHFMPKKV